MPNPLKKVKKVAGKIDDGLKRTLEVVGLPAEAAVQVAQIMAESAKDYYNKKPKEGSQPLTKGDMTRAMDIGTGMAGGTVNWMGGAGKINAARAAEMEAARMAAAKAAKKAKLSPDDIDIKLLEDEIDAFKSYLTDSPTHPDNSFIRSFDHPEWQQKAPVYDPARHPNPRAYFDDMIKTTGIEGYVQQVFEDLEFVRNRVKNAKP